ncbi:protein MAINTENANCE OF MERISTEMS-like [Gossypium raimondii]|uniref:protein MAINTENANCE OF MERISTEMS-like n=1 Tax=Gossypium raimondii TaxID=29730 RepID=UPI00227AB298|nr:protein MAINTENANCE OF MERISTEMS-like [Gossypium raimondii]
MAGFRDVVLIRRFDLRADSISALVKRWCMETHTFIMPCGECTITLEDVAMQLGLRVDGVVVTGRSNVLEPSVLCHRLLGWSPNDGERNFICLTLKWLRANFKELSSTATEYEVMCAARAYIMQLIGGWATSPGIGASQTLIIYRQMIEAYAREKFLWMSYSAMNIATIIPQ